MSDALRKELPAIVDFGPSRRAIDPRENWMRPRVTAEMKPLGGQASDILPCQVEIVEIAGRRLRRKRLRQLAGKPPPAARATCLDRRDPFAGQLSTVQLVSELNLSEQGHDRTIEVRAFKAECRKIPKEGLDRKSTRLNSSHT